MNKRNVRKPMLVGFGLMAGVMLISSAAFACTIYKGQLYLTGNHPSSGTKIMTGNNASMSYCAESGGEAIVNAAPNPAVVKEVKVAPASGIAGCPNSSLPTGKYDINWVNGAAMTHNPSDPTGKPHDWVIDCMSPLGKPMGSESQTTMQVTNGSGSATNVTVSPNAPNGPADDSAICVSTPNGVYGMQGPVRVAV